MVTAVIKQIYKNRYQKAIVQSLATKKFWTNFRKRRKNLQLTRFRKQRPKRRAMYFRLVIKATPQSKQKPTSRPNSHQAKVSSPVNPYLNFDSEGISESLHALIDERIRLIKLLKIATKKFNEACLGLQPIFLDELRKEFGDMLNLDNFQVDNIDRLRKNREKRISDLQVFDTTYPDVRALHNRIVPPKT